MPALDDAASLLDTVVHYDKEELKAEFKQTIEGYLDETIIVPLGRSFENDLRLHIHTVYIQGIERQNPFKETNLAWYL
jgi:hypothetical protein